MTRRLSITSTSNDRLKAVRRLSRRRDDGCFLVQGHRPVRQAIEAGARVLEVYAAPGLYLGDEDSILVARAERLGARVVELSVDAFRSISHEARPDGIAAVVERWPTGLGRLRLPPEPLVAVAQGIERPGNLGTIVRTAAAAGADALVVCDAPTDLFHPKVVRGSVGTLFGLRVAQATSELVLPWLAEHGLRLVVATPGGSRSYWEPDYRGPAAIVVGGERYGVAEPWLDAADETVRIPMTGVADSVNVAVAAGVVWFEAARARAALTAAR